jgi:hypothetical protein
MCAGMLSGARRLRQQRCSTSSSTQSPVGTATAAAAAGGETLRTRFNKYALTKEGRLGPVREPHKDALFAQLQAAGGQLCYRWGCATAGVSSATAALSGVCSLQSFISLLYVH